MAKLPHDFPDKPLPPPPKPNLESVFWKHVDNEWGTTPVSTIIDELNSELESWGTKNAEYRTACKEREQQLRSLVYDLERPQVEFIARLYLQGKTNKQIESLLD
jgi:hypothetical protein